MQNCTQMVSFSLLPWPAMGSPLHGHPRKLHGKFSIDSRLMLVITLTKWITVCMLAGIVLTRCHWSLLPHKVLNHYYPHVIERDKELT